MAQEQDERGGTGRQDRAARVAAMQQAERAGARRRRIAAIAIPTVLVLGVAAGVTAVITNQPEPPSLAAVKTFGYSNAEQHTEEAQDYPEVPPVGGPHNPVWLNCGVYDAPVPNENAVHSMEHGAVWITYAPDLPAAQLATLKDDVADQSYTVLSPYEGLPSPVVLSAWNTQLQVQDAADPRVDAFLAKYVNGPQTPEPGALCSNGTGTPTG